MTANMSYIDIYDAQSILIVLSNPKFLTHSPSFDFFSYENQFRFVKADDLYSERNSLEKKFAC